MFSQDNHTQRMKKVWKKHLFSKDCTYPISEECPRHLLVSLILFFILLSVLCLLIIVFSITLFPLKLNYEAKYWWFLRIVILIKIICSLNYKNRMKKLLSVNILIAQISVSVLTKSNCFLLHYWVLAAFIVPSSTELWTTWLCFARAISLHLVCLNKTRHFAIHHLHPFFLRFIQHQRQKQALQKHSKL